MDALRVTSLRKFHWLGGSENEEMPQGLLVDAGMWIL